VRSSQISGRRPALNLTDCLSVRKVFFGIIPDKVLNHRAKFLLLLSATLRRRIVGVEVKFHSAYRRQMLIPIFMFLTPLRFGEEPSDVH
jgi:hypothetical protein